MRLKIKRLTDTAIIPKYQSNGAAGIDLRFDGFRNCDTSQLGTGLAAEIPYGYVGVIVPRSSLGKRGFVLSNTAAIIDADYRGEIILLSRSLVVAGFELGERIAQMLILPCPQLDIIEVDELSETERGSGGFGSTGK